MFRSRPPRMIEQSAALAGHEILSTFRRMGQAGRTVVGAKVLEKAARLATNVDAEARSLRPTGRSAPGGPYMVSPAAVVPRRSSTTP
jgi:hypothetical protein